MNQQEFSQKMKNIYFSNRKISINTLIKIANYLVPNQPLKLKKNINTNFMINLDYNNGRLLRYVAKLYVDPNNFPKTEIQKKQAAQLFKNAVTVEIEKQYVNFKPTTTAHSRVSNNKESKKNKSAPGTPQSKRRKVPNK
jgi:hypothetical protein